MGPCHCGVAVYPRSVTSIPAGETLLEDLTPWDRSLAWRVSQAAWGARGQALFRQGAVPHIRSDDGVRAGRAAELLLQSCLAAAEAGRLEPRVQLGTRSCRAFEHLFLQLLRVRLLP